MPASEREPMQGWHSQRCASCQRLFPLDYDVHEPWTCSMRCYRLFWGRSPRAKDRING